MNKTKNNLATFVERIKSAWICLTYKEFFVSGVKRREVGNTGARSYYSTLDTKESHPFISAIHKTTADDNSEYSIYNTFNV